MTNDKLTKSGRKPLFRSASTKSTSACNYAYHNNQPNWKEPVPKGASTLKFKLTRFNKHRWGCGNGSPSSNSAGAGAKIHGFLWQVFPGTEYLPAPTSVDWCQKQNTVLWRMTTSLVNLLPAAVNGLYGPTTDRATAIKTQCYSSCSISHPSEYYLRLTGDGKKTDSLALLATI